LGRKNGLVWEERKGKTSSRSVTTELRGSQKNPKMFKFRERGMRLIKEKRGELKIRANGRKKPLN